MCLMAWGAEQTIKGLRIHKAIEKEGKLFIYRDLVYAGGWRRKLNGAVLDKQMASASQATGY